MNPFPLVKGIKVGLDFGKSTMPVGRLAMRERTIYFAYESSFIATGLEISLFRLPLKLGVTAFDSSLFEGLPWKISCLVVLEFILLWIDWLLEAVTDLGPWCTNLSSVWNQQILL